MMGACLAWLRGPTAADHVADFLENPALTEFGGWDRMPLPWGRGYVPYARFDARDRTLFWAMRELARRVREEEARVPARAVAEYAAGAAVGLAILALVFWIAS